MNDQNPTPTPVDVTPSKPRFRDRLHKNTDPTHSVVKTSSFKDKVKNTAAVVGVVALVGGVAAYVANKRNVTGVDVTLPAVDVTTDAN